MHAPVFGDLTKFNSVPILLPCPSFSCQLALYLMIIINHYARLRAFLCILLLEPLPTANQRSIALTLGLFHDT